MSDAFSIIRRAVASTLANWPLLLVQIVEIIVLVVLILGGALLAIVTVGLSVDWDMIESFGSPDSDPGAIAEAAAEWFVANAVAAAVVGFVVLLLFGVATLIHSYFQAGVTGVFVEYEQRGETWDWRDAWRRFELQKVIDYAVARGWRAFLIYNVVWGVAGLFLLVPLVVILALMLLLGDGAAAIVVACCGILLVLVAGVSIAIVAGAWAQIAITIGIATPRGAAASCSAAGDLIRAHTGKVVIVMLVFFAASVGVSTVSSTMGLAFDAASMLPGGDLFALPLRIAFTAVSSLASSILGLCLASCFAIIVHESQFGPSGGKRAD
ncbi:MAG: hypothetical protein ACSLFQ_15330 [Thermoanaerobaculia bacterium]